MSVRVLCVNSGSSSLKVALYEDETPIASGAVEGIGLEEGRLTVRDAAARVADGCATSALAHVRSTRHDHSHRGVPHAA